MKRLVFAACPLLVLAGCSGGDDDGGGGRDPRFDALAAQLEAELESIGAPGVSIALLEDGEVVWAEGFGSRHADEEQAAKATTLYRIGSCNKALTAAALLRKVEAGTVALDDVVTEHSPAFHFDENATWADTITLRHLLTHSSGMIDYLAIDGPTDDAALQNFLTGTGPEDFGSFALLMAPSGEFWNYSNPNFYVSALVDEQTSSGTYYRQILKEGVLDPLGMDRTFFTAEEVLDDGNYAVARTYNYVNGGAGTLLAGPDSYDNAWARPAGYAWSSVLDMAKFLQFLLDGNTEVLSDALRAEMQSPVISTDYFFDYSNYGYGLLVDPEFQVQTEWYQEKLVFHDGAIPGFSAVFYLVPGTRFGLVILSNDDGAYFPNTAAMALRDFGGLPAPVAIPDPGIDSADFPEFVATYEDSYNFGTIVVTTAGNSLQVSMPDLDAISVPYSPDLLPYSENNFVMEVQGYPFLATFFLDSANDPQYLRTRFGVGVAQPAAFAPAPPPAVDAESLRVRLGMAPEAQPAALRLRGSALAN